MTAHRPTPAPFRARNTQRRPLLAAGIAACTAAATSACGGFGWDSPGPTSTDKDVSDSSSDDGLYDIDPDVGTDSSSDDGIYDIHPDVAPPPDPMMVMPAQPALLGDDYDQACGEPESKQFNPGAVADINGDGVNDYIVVAFCGDSQVNTYIVSGASKDAEKPLLVHIGDLADPLVKRFVRDHEHAAAVLVADPRWRAVIAYAPDDTSMILASWGHESGSGSAPQRVKALTLSGKNGKTTMEYAENYNMNRFTTPTGNITCALSESTAACRLIAREWGDCGVMQVTTKSAAKEHCEPTVGLEPGAPPASYGSTFVGGDTMCHVATSGVACTTINGAGFTVSRETATRFDPKKSVSFGVEGSDDWNE